MKIIYDNIIFALQKAGGISLYWAEMIKRLKLKEEQMMFYEPENQNIFRKELHIQGETEGNIPVKILKYLPLMKKMPARSIFHSSYYRTSFQKDIIKIVTVYDFTYEYYRCGLARFIHSLQKNFAIKNADGIICISDNTQKDLFKFLPNIDKEKVRTIYISSNEEFHQIDNLDEVVNNSQFSNLKEKKNILYVGDRKSDYKNFKLVVDVVEKLTDFNLVSAGAGELTDQEKDLLKTKLGDRFIHFTAISSAHLNILYNISFCLMYPSSYEGFGIPILEAMRAGCPVVSTNFSSIPEVAGEAGVLVDTIDVDSLVKAVNSLQNVSLRKNIIERGVSQANKFSWDKCFSETMNFYQDVYRRKFIK